MNNCKFIAVLSIMIILTGCSASPPKQTQPKGDLTPIYINQDELNER